MKDLDTVEPRTPVSPTTTPGDADSLFKIVQPGSYYLTGNITGVVGKSGIEIAASGVTIDLMGFDLLGVAGSLNGVASVSVVTDIAVLNGSVRNWGTDGVHLATAENTRLADLRVSGNGAGIYAGDNAVVTGCAAFLNGFVGIVMNSGGVLTNCSAYDNTVGIFTGPGCTITNCVARSNTFSGIDASDGSTIADCSARFNGDLGIGAGFGSAITNCSASDNGGDGIYATIGCTVRGNACDGNGFGVGDGAGIHVLDPDNRVEGNSCTNNDRGIDVDSAGNFITRNTCSGNTTNWDVVAGNVCLVVSATASGAILGNSGGVAPGSTDPNANFTY
jgi:parallel beta-helix repeat protein